MYFLSCAVTVASLLAFATFNYFLDEVELEKPVSTGLKWSSLAAAAILVFAVQLGVQTLPMLLSGKKPHDNVSKWYFQAPSRAL